MLGRAKDIAIKPTTLAAPAAPRMLLPGVSLEVDSVIPTTHMPIVHHCPHLQTSAPPVGWHPSEFACHCKHCKHSKRESQRIDEISDSLLPTVLPSCHSDRCGGVPPSLCASPIRLYKYCLIMLYHVISCYSWRRQPHSRSPTFLFPPHLVPWLPGATKAEAAIKAAVPVAAPAILDMAGMVAPQHKSSWCCMPLKKSTD